MPTVSPSLAAAIPLVEASVVQVISGSVQISGVVIAPLSLVLTASLPLSDAPLATIIAISGDLPAAVAAYARRRGLRYTLAHDAESNVARQYGLTYESGDRGDVAAPAAVILDREGRVAWFHVARDVRDRPDPDDLLDALRSIP